MPAKIQPACRETRNRILVSGTLLGRMSTLPTNVVSLPLGKVKLRGKEADLELFALEKA
jgi:hypothetical protein